MEEKKIIGGKFALGQLVATRGVHAHLEENDINILPYIASHVSGDWGRKFRFLRGAKAPTEIRQGSYSYPSKDDKQANENALIYGDRILSAYTLRTGKRIWIITEADRHATTVLFPSEY